MFSFYVIWLSDISLSLIYTISGTYYENMYPGPRGFSYFSSYYSELRESLESRETANTSRKARLSRSPMRWNIKKNLWDQGRKYATYARNMLIVPKEPGLASQNIDVPSKKSSYVVLLFAFLYPILYMKPIRSHISTGSSFRLLTVISDRFAYPSRCRSVLCNSDLRISNWATSFSLL